MHPPDPLRLCTEPGCTVKPHYENCRDCFGFGLYREHFPISASTAETMRAGGQNGLTCATCGSNAYGPTACAANA